MAITKFMEVMFSASAAEDEELLNQTASDIEAAKKDGKVVDEDNQITYVNLGEGVVQAVDEGHGGEITLISTSEDGNYDLAPGNPAIQSEQIEGYLHPEVDDKVEVGAQQGEKDEKAEEHMTGEDVIAPNKEDGGLNPEAGQEKTVEETAQEGSEGGEKCPECGNEPCTCEEEKKEDEDEEEEKEFSVSTDNTVVLRVFSDQEFCERLFSEVIDTEESTKIGDLKIEKVEGEDAVVVTDCETGDAAKVTLDGEDMDIQELDQKELCKQYSEEGDEFTDEGAEGYNQLHVVGVDPFNHVIVDAEEYEEDSAAELANRLTEDGVDAVQVFDNASDARDYAIDLLGSLGVEDSEDIEEPVQAEYSDHTIYLTKFYSNHTDYMMKVFSEAVNDVDASQAVIEDAIQNGDEIEVDTEIITPVDSKTAIVEDKENGELTKVTIEDEEMSLDPISKAEAEELTDHLEVEEEGKDEDEDVENDTINGADDDDDNEEDEKDFSDIWTNDAQTRFFSENEEMTDYMVRIFSEEADQNEIEKAIAEGEQIENDTEVITPVDAKTAIVEDKENGEFTKAVLDDDNIDMTAISEEEADKLTDGLAVEDTDEDEDEDKKAEEEKPEEEEKEFSTLDKFFADAVAGGNQAEPEIIQAVVDPKTGNLVPFKEEPEAPSVEAIEDKALQAVQSIQEAAAEASAQILEAKQAPVENQEEDLQEAQFSEKEKTFSNTNDTLISWLGGNRLKK